jgi:predicted phosphodiesterase
MTAIVALGDVHGNARALAAAISQALSGPCDQIVFMGDLLTYGHDVEAVLELVAEAQDKHNAVLLIGNHDQMYFDLAQGKRDYLDRLPGWIQDSVALTVKKFDPASLRSRLSWLEEWQHGPAVFAHANPFGFGDFRYLNNDQDINDARSALTRRGATLGVFGHTHRAHWTPGPTVVANAGSVGQPRDAAAQSVFLRIEIDGPATTGTIEPIHYDVQAHLDELRRSGLPEDTIARLGSFFKPR